MTGDPRKITAPIADAPPRSLQLSRAAVTRTAFVVAAVALTAAVVRFDVATPLLGRYGAPALLAGLAVGALGEPYAIAVLLCATPLLGVIPYAVGLPEISLPEHLFAAILLVGAIQIARRNRPRAATPIDRPLAMYMALIAVSGATGLWEYCRLGPSLWDIVGPQLQRHFAYGIGDFANGRFLIVHYTIVAAEAALWFALLTAPQFAVRAAHVRGGLIAGATAVIVVGIAQSSWHFGLRAFFERVQPELHRINSTLPDPNTLGSFLVLLFPIGLVAALERRRGATALAAAWSAGLGYCLIRSVSRTSWIGFAVTAGVALAIAASRPEVLGISATARTRQLLRRALACAVAVTIVAVLSVSFGLLGKQLSYQGAQSPVDMLLFTLNARRPVDELLPARLDHWHAAYNIWRDFPIFGAGIGKYTVLKGRYLPEARGHWMFFTEPHNYYLKVLCEMGAIGLIAFVAVLASIAVQARQAWRLADQVRRRRIAAVVAGLGSFLLCSLGQDPLILREMQYLFWAVVALLVFEAREARALIPAPPFP